MRPVRIVISIANTTALKTLLRTNLLMTALAEIALGTGKPFRGHPGEVNSPSREYIPRCPRESQTFIAVEAARETFKHVVIYYQIRQQCYRTGSGAGVGRRSAHNQSRQLKKISYRVTSRGHPPTASLPPQTPQLHAQLRTRDARITPNLHGLSAQCAPSAHGAGSGEVGAVSGGRICVPSRGRGVCGAVDLRSGCLRSPWCGVVVCPRCPAGWCCCFRVVECCGRQREVGRVCHAGEV